MGTPLNNIGEAIVIDWLSRRGFSRVTVVASGSQFNYIEADGSRNRMLTKVLTAMRPDESPTEDSMSVYEWDEFLTLGTHKQRECWLAAVVIDEHQKIVGEIKWTKLSDSKTV